MDFHLLLRFAWIAAKFTVASSAMGHSGDAERIDDDGGDLY